MSVDFMGDGVSFKLVAMETNAKNLKKADTVFFVAGIVALAGAMVCVFLFKGGTILPPKRVPLVFAQWWESGMEEGTLRGIITDFEREHPQVTVRLHNSGWEDIRDGLLYADGEVPDVIAVDTGRLAEVVTSGLLDVLPQDVFPDHIPSPEGEGIPPVSLESPASSIPPIEAEAADTDRHRYYLPVVCFLHPLFYNIDLLSAAGFLRPPHTREEFLDYARKVTDPAEGVYGTAFSRNTWTDVFPWIWAGGTGGSIENIRWRSRPVTDTLAFLSVLNKEHLVHPSPLTKREDELLEAFLAGRIAMFISSQASASEIRAKKPSLAFDVTTIPKAAQTEGRNVFPVTEWALAIPAKSAHKEEALSLLRYLAGRKNDVAAAARGIAGYRYEYSAAGETPVDQKLRALYESSETATVSTLGGDAETVLNDVRDSLLPLFRGEKTEAETAAALQAAFTQAGLTMSNEEP